MGVEVRWVRGMGEGEWGGRSGMGGERAFWVYRVILRCGRMFCGRFIFVFGV